MPTLTVTVAVNCVSSCELRLGLTNAVAVNCASCRELWFEVTNAVTVNYVSYSELRIRVISCRELKTGVTFAVSELRQFP